MPSDEPLQGTNPIKANETTATEGFFPQVDNVYPINNKVFLQPKNKETSHNDESTQDKDSKAPAMSDPVSKDLLDAHLGRIEEKILHSEARIEGKLNLLLEKFNLVQEVYTEQNKNLNEHMAHTQQLYTEQHQSVKDQIERVWQVSLGIFGSLLVGFIILIVQNMTEKPEKSAPPVVISIPAQAPVTAQPSSPAPSKPR